MKKGILFILCFVLALAYQNASAQTGIRAGWNYPDVQGVEAGANMGFHAGVYSKLNMLGIVAIEPGVQYSQKGCKPENIGSSPKDRLHYIDFPVLVRVGIFPMINLFAGPQASFLVARKYEGSTDFSTIGEMKNYELGGVAGIGVNLPLGFNVQGSYDFGLTSINYDGKTTQNSVIKVSLGKSF
ncbi:porin family protein [Echinicola jeungdonensis]|uniref:Porin family protein n=1 Tax=Echinicola jeungdonensis TaxID=709343 RepID=A0ABV5J2F0_9BACT|nr:porin family protein [Echinicola jeungdonensis]MDN3667955.1 porin family protein [Echinicola jeungdonensis]